MARRSPGEAPLTARPPPHWPLRIGALSAMVGASPKALRLYEAMGLMPAPQRQGRYRVYGPLHADTVALIRHAQQLGFTLKELRTLAGQARLVDVVPLGLARQAAAAKRARLQAQLKALHAQVRQLQRFEATLVSAQEQACACPDWAQGERTAA